jgi:hypothetical protein
MSLPMTIRHQLHISRQLNPKAGAYASKELTEIGRRTFLIRLLLAVGLKRKFEDRHVRRFSGKRGRYRRVEPGFEGIAQHRCVSPSQFRPAVIPDGLESGTAPGLNGRQNVLVGILDQRSVLLVHAIIGADQLIDPFERIVLCAQKLICLLDLVVDEFDDFFSRGCRPFWVWHRFGLSKGKFEQVALLNFRPIGAKICRLMEIEPGGKAAVKHGGQ